MQSRDIILDGVGRVEEEKKYSTNIQIIEPFLLVVSDGMEIYVYK
jgi:hypothetical protein